MARFAGFDRYIQDAMESWHCPGAAVAVVKGDEVLYKGAFGLRDIAQNLPMTDDTRFAMASVTKSFTAMSVALLVDEGKLEWDKPVREYVPEFVLDDAYATQHVTARDMLSHRTGMPRHDLAAWRLDMPRAEFIKRMKHLKFSASFREKFQYNNLMYYATAYLVEKVAGQRWEDFVHDRIFAPLGMEASNFAPKPVQSDQVTAHGYRVDRDDEGNAIGHLAMPFGPHTELSPGAAGALFSSLADLMQWLHVHVNGGRVGDTQLVSADNLKQMHLPQMVIPGGGVSEALFGNTLFAYGLGWFVEPYRGYTLVHHGGNVEGHSLIVGFVPQAGVGVIGLTNIAMLPLRDVLLYEGIDRALGLEERDWNARLHQLYAPMIAGQAKAKGTAAEERIADAPPSHPLEAYTGTFEAKGYPDIAVRLVEDDPQASDGRTDASEAEAPHADRLQARIVGGFDWSELRHYHYDVFEYYMSDFDERLKVRFLVNDNGAIDSISVPIEPAVDNVVFTRKPAELEADVLAALVGEYAPPIDGLSFTVTVSNDKVYVTQSGNPPTEVKAYKVEADLVGFTWDRVRFDFVRKGEKFTTLILKMPGMTLEAPRK